ncbi:hypothetical protein ACIBIZ_35555 [Nonomuraea spiralis]|uniref:hypothetical protein n=1 Tax=Nonomuraea TaxID=83681 RepID=UPI000F7A4328|nr:hypothetical protein [Nonomuraea sp. WAC 01424]RSN04824.1 hypothetical protein DMB42_28920 [Nonomuraea sp. WAC 01424]
MRRGLYLPPFGELADPRVLADLAVRAEDAGPYEAAGATWWLVQFPEVTTAEQVISALTRG